ncbi:hypothetical protein MUO66_01735 [Candidatus Bathyarchaeota archaeon]|nr:hypothetical protein [Candidatus Bathyarchaeota archaeon]
MKKGIIILAVLVISFTLVASLLTENALAATPNTSKFAYEVKGKENSSLRDPKTITLCNYTTPPDSGIIVQIGIYLTGIPEGSHVRAVIFANEPDAKFPQGGEPLAQSVETLNVVSVSGEWYNFTMNYPASQNTVYWLGYYSDNFTQYFFDADSDHISVTSQPKDENSSWLPVSWSYKGKSIMSLYALYTVADPQPSPTSTDTGSSILNISDTSQSFQDTVFVLLIIGGETAIMVTDKNREKKNTPSNNNFISASVCKTPSEV